MRRRFLLVTLLIIFSLVLAACGRGEEAPAEPEQPAATEAATPAEAEAAETPTEEAAAPAEGAAASEEVTGTEEVTGAEEVTATEEVTETEEVTGAEEVTETASAGAAGGTVIKVATQSPLSGPQSVLGVAIKNGAQLALEQRRAEVEALGFSLELVPFDDQATPDIGVANAKQIVADPAILCLVGHLNSGVMIPSMEEYHNAGLAAVSPANTNPVVTDRGYPEINRVVGRDDVQGVVGQRFAFEELGLQSVYIIHDKTAYGQGVAEFFRQAAEEAGMQVLGFEGTEEQANFDSIITPIIAANPELVYFGGIYSQAGIFFRQAREKGVQATFMGPDGMDSSELASLAGDAVVGMYYSTVAGPPTAYPGTAQFIADYEEAFGEQVQPFAAQAYDSMNICINGIISAIEANGGEMPSRAQVAEAVRATADYPGITGTITFNEKGDKTVATYFVLQVQSADPAEWNNNQVVQTLEIEAPTE
ncbi:MAG TPA: branched-chain amino acid ABC transporter substrate-binding protein [Caldilineaceae bacterium]|nr:branched-chain amino acid ABC transporter substrate-binding protein [Caldilineaceae bacterium]